MAVLHRFYCRVQRVKDVEHLNCSICAPSIPSMFPLTLVCLSSDPLLCEPVSLLSHVPSDAVSPLFPPTWQFSHDILSLLLPSFPSQDAPFLHVLQLQKFNDFSRTIKRYCCSFQGKVFEKVRSTLNNSTSPKRVQTGKALKNSRTFFTIVLIQREIISM